jgi:hypothetical protein|tara:strand:+ start:12357 stop:12533 length:177 start_codon:yes stop_codon:yes gene_type:complete
VLPLLWHLKQDQPRPLEDIPTGNLLSDDDLADSLQAGHGLTEDFFTDKDKAFDMVCID